jgi:hypothetical protein
MINLMTPNQRCKELANDAIICGCAVCVVGNYFCGLISCLPIRILVHMYQNNLRCPICTYEEDLDQDIKTNSGENSDNCSYCDDQSTYICLLCKKKLCTSRKYLLFYDNLMIKKIS